MQVARIAGLHRTGIAQKRFLLVLPVLHGGGIARLRGRRAFVLTLSVTVVALLGAVVAATLFGDATLLLGDVGNWLTGRSGQLVTYILDTRVPRVVAALLAGAALAVAGAVVQAVSRNPLAEPGVLGVVSGAGVGAVTVLTFVPLASFWLISGSALAGAAAAAMASQPWAIAASSSPFRANAAAYPAWASGRLVACRVRASSTASRPASTARRESPRTRAT